MRFILPFLLFLGLGYASPAQSQERVRPILREGSISLVADTSLPLSRPDSTSASLRWDVPRVVERHPILTGAAMGSVISLGIWYYMYVTDDYCEDPDMLPCEATIPIAFVSGGVIGGFAGFVLDTLISSD